MERVPAGHSEQVHEKDHGGHVSNATVPMDTMDAEADIPFQASEDEPSSVPYVDASSHSLQLLNHAARMIADVDEDEVAAQNGGRGPRASRLAPLRDISADIRRDSTPLPNTAFSTELGTRNALDEKMPDLWPWLHTAEIDEEKDDWVDRTDPLLARKLPSSPRLRRLLTGEGLARMFKDARQSPRQRWRLIFIGLCLLTMFALVVDAVLVTFVGHAGPQSSSGLPPTMNLSTRVANQGEQVTIHLRDFGPFASIVLSHDIQEPLTMLNEKGIVHVDAKGSKDVVMVIDSSWQGGSHTIAAEDMATRYTASAMLMIGNDPSRPAHLQLGTTKVDFGTSFEGANSLKTITLNNNGGGIISWAASSSDSWLMVTPDHGMFSDHQVIQIAVDRNKLKPGDYNGKVTFSSNVSAPQDVAVHMKVEPLPPDAGAVLNVSPALLSFTAIDGMADPAAQSLTITNPGKKVLNWTIKSQLALEEANTNRLYNLVGMNPQWLKPDVTSGQVVPGETASVKINVHSFNLLPGTYNQVLTFTAGNGALNSPQNVGISLTVQPRCSLALNTGSLAFTAVAGQSSASSQALNLLGNTSCNSGASWQATSSVHWLTLAPASGQLQDAATGSTTATVSAVGLQPGTYSGTITITLGQSTQTVAVQLTVQAPPPPSAPILGASPLSLNFSMTKGKPNPPAQSITVANTGKSPLTWRVLSRPLASWLNVTQGQSTLNAGDTNSVLVNVDASGLTPGSYTSQITLNGIDNSGNLAGGSPQTVGVTFTVSAPCTLALPSATSLAFNTTQGAPDPVAQQFTFSASGNCNWPLSVKLDHNASASWMKYTGSDKTNNTFTLATSGQSATIMVGPSNAGLAAGDFRDSITISATDSSAQSVPGSPQSLDIDMVVLKPCTLQANSAGLNFSAPQGGQSTASQSIPLSLSGSCVLPVGWTVSADSIWIQPKSSSGIDNGQGSSLDVSINTSGLGVGTYNGIITITPTGNNGASVDGKPQIPVTLTITGATVNVTINSCPTSDCALPAPLPGAQVALYDGSGNQISSKTADSSGVAVFNNIPIGTYRVTANGTDIGQVNYTGDSSVSVTGTIVTLNMNVFPPATPTPDPTP
ncbi:hypothetical protein KDA_13320 [Dictyobacter alpinus]|uniref:BACON domain-containing protein n=1 Tax=Dictyobacter alpinus TaxID=2014873 RepID=A0A402B3D8_9CHLR|nr:hypothetical protein KDA_13320 [Dictyobacter alpinus]